MKIEVFGGRFGLGGKEFNPAMVKAVFQNIEQTNPKNHFTVGIDDDVSKTSLPYEKNYAPISNNSEILILGIGSDGSVSSAKNYAKIVGEENKFVKAYFMYDSKKSGGLTRSYITISNQQIEKPYLSTNLDVIVVNNASYLFKFDIAKNLKQNGTLIINSPFENDLDFDEYVPNFVKKTIAEKNAKIYSINANKIASENNIDGKISNIMLMALIEKTEFANKKNAKEKCEEFIKKSLSQKGDDVVLCNIKAIGLVNNFVIEIKTKDEWKNINDEKINEKSQKNT